MDDEIEDEIEGEAKVEIEDTEVKAEDTLDTLDTLDTPDTVDELDEPIITKKRVRKQSVAV